MFNLNLGLLNITMVLLKSIYLLFRFKIIPNSNLNISFSLFHPTRIYSIIRFYHGSFRHLGQFLVETYPELEPRKP